jgi:hypothetical protein
MWGIHQLALTLGTLSIAVSGNHFVNGAGQTVRLLGVDHPGTEYACEQGWAYSDGDDDPTAAASDAAAIASWNANAVRVPLNEDCWLGINGRPSGGLTVSGYRQTVESLVTDLNADGLYAILDLHWSAPGTTVADEQRPMADSHSTAFWSSVAQTFKGNPAVLFDAFNEPYSPAADYRDAAGYPLSWSCWQNGGCTLPVTADGTDPGSHPATYSATGMQQLIDAIRSTGATQPILLGGLSYSNDLTGWLAHEPTDPDHQLAASFHTYEGNACADVSCFQSEVAPVAAQVPVVITEFDENPCAGAGDDFDQSLMSWADGVGVSYLAWGWYAGATPDCNDFYLDDASDDPVAPNGTLLKAHLATASAVSGTVSGSTLGSGTMSKSPAGSTDSPLSAPSAPGSALTSTSDPTRPRCVVPNVLGDRLAQARRRLRSAGCVLGRVVYRKRARSSAASGRRARVNTVIRELPAAGHSAPGAARVELFIAPRVRAGARPERLTWLP